MKLLIQQKIQAGFLVALAILLTVGAIGWWSARQNLEAFRVVEQSRQVLKTLKGILVETLNTETGNRGYVVSGDDTFLIPHQEGMAAVGKALEEAQRLILDHPEQQRRLDDLRSLVQQKIQFGQETILLRRSGDRAAAIERISSGRGQAMMDEIRRIIREMEGTEDIILQQRTAEANALARLTTVTVALGGTMALVLVGLASWLVRRDFEKRQQAEAERDRFFNVSQDLLCIANADGYFKRISPSFVQALGWSESELLRRPFLEFVHPDDRDATLREVERQVKAGQRVMQFENRYQHADGSWHWLSWKSVPQPGGWMYATARDVTEQKARFEALREAERRLAERNAFHDTILRCAGSGIIATTVEGLITHFNPAAERMLGYAAGEVVGLLRLDAFHDTTELAARGPQDMAASKFGILVAQARRGETEAHEWTYVRKDGSRFPVFLSVTALQDAAGVTSGFLAIARDITERKRLELEIRRSEENLAVTLRSIGDAVLATDTNRRVTRMNPVAEALTGWSEAEALGRPIDDVFRIINEETRLPGVIPVDDVLSTEEIHGLANHTALIARDGSERSIADSAAPIRDMHGQILGVVLVFRDVTDDRHAEKKINALMRELTDVRQALDHHCIVAITNADGIITYANDRFCKISKYSREELLGRDHRILNSGRHSREFFRELWGTIEGGNVWQGEIRNRAKDGSHYWMATTIVPFLGPDGKPVQFVAIRTDITARKLVEEELSRLNADLERRVEERASALQESERFARATLDALSAHVAILDERGVIIATNLAWRNFAVRNGLDPALVGPGVNYLEVGFRERTRTLDSASRIEQAIRDVIKGAQTEFALEYDCHSPTRKQWFICRVSRFEGDGPVRVVVTHEDVSQVKSLERQQRHSQRLESLGTLAGGVAHDLNNALAPVMMSLDLLRVTYPGETQMLDMVKASVQRAADMVRQLLTFSKGAEGVKGSVQPAHLLKEIRGILQGTLPKNIQLQVRCDMPLPTVMADATQLHQVLLNLCVNARDAMPNGGVLLVEAEHCVIDELYAASVPDSTPGEFVLLRVQDSGTGMPPEIIDRIFDPFFTTKAVDKGTGLGLSTVLGIVKGHGGFMRVYSQPGEGSIFTVYLPAEKSASHAAGQSGRTCAFRGHGENILIVDDEPAIRQIQRIVLQRLGFTSTTATDGADALMQVATLRDELHAIIVDMHMPNMNGLDFIRAVRRFLPDLPILAASGRFDEAIEAELASLNVRTLLSKPFTEAELGMALERLLKPIQAR